MSRELAELIGRISAQTQKQSASVTDVTRGMQGILRITERDDRGHEADERVDRPTDEARRRVAQFGRRLQGVTTVWRSTMEQRARVE